MTLCGSGIIPCHGLDLAREDHHHRHTSEKRNQQDTCGAMNTKGHDDPQIHVAYANFDQTSILDLCPQKKGPNPVEAPRHV
jgi:hypothetical protein